LGKTIWNLGKKVQKAVKESLFVINDEDRIEDNKILMMQH